MQGFSKFLVLDKYQLIYVTLPKCASTSMHRLFLNLSGINTDLDVRKAIWTEELVEQREKVGLRGLLVEDAALPAFLRQHSHYVWFTAVRNPYDRIFSAYNLQIRRYAERYSKKVLRRAKIAPYLQNPFSRRRVKTQVAIINEVKQQIPFLQFLQGLALHGVGFDRHFDLQTKVIRFETIKFDLVAKIETLSTDLDRLLGQIGAGDGMAQIPTLNPSSTLRPKHESLTQVTKEITFDIYQKDFQDLEYNK